MKLLYDENISPRLVSLTREFYPGSVHVCDAGLGGTSDLRIWEYARDHDLMIVSKDDDFRQRSLVEGAPPKVVWLQVGNAATNTICELLLQRRSQLQEFYADSESSVLILRLDLRPA